MRIPPIARTTRIGLVPFDRVPRHFQSNVERQVNAYVVDE